MFKNKKIFIIGGICLLQFVLFLLVIGIVKNNRLRNDNLTEFYNQKNILENSSIIRCSTNSVTELANFQIITSSASNQGNYRIKVIVKTSSNEYEILHIDHDYYYVIAYYEKLFSNDEINEIVGIASKKLLENCKVKFKNNHDDLNQLKQLLN
jgi:hypothetical protein